MTTTAVGFGGGYDTKASSCSQAPADPERPPADTELPVADTEHPSAYTEQAPALVEQVDPEQHGSNNPNTEEIGHQASGPTSNSNEVQGDRRKDKLPVVLNPLVYMIKERREKERIKTENLKMTTVEFLEKSKPENSKNNIKTALKASIEVCAERNASRGRARHNGAS